MLFTIHLLFAGNLTKFWSSKVDLCLCSLEDQAPFGSLIDGYDRHELASVFNTLDWTNEQILGLQKVATDSPQITYCIYSEDYAQEVSHFNNQLIT